MRFMWLTVFMFVLGGCHEPTLIISEPSGARIEVQGDYVGEAPIEVVLPRYSLPLYVVATPIHDGQYQQTKVYHRGDPVPSRIFFDMRLVPAPDERIEIKLESD